VADSPAERKVPASPANPAIVKNRPRRSLLNIPPDSDVLGVFASLRRDNSMTDEEALLKLITSYFVSLRSVNEIAGNVNFYSASSPTFSVAPLVTYC
jgi:hypothetical protein